MYRAPPPPPDSNAHLVWVTFLEHDEQAILTGWICFVSGTDEMSIKHERDKIGD
jgi:hypothetical protein